MIKFLQGFVMFLLTFGAHADGALTITPPQNSLPTQLDVNQAIRPYGTTSYYCPKNRGYINIGMTIDQVIAACGEPSSKEVSNQPLQEKIFMTQMIFNNLGSSQVTGTVNSQSSPLTTGVIQGVQLEVDIIDNKVSDIKMNGSTSNAFSLCGGASIQIGDPVSSVYANCPNPSIVNSTFIYKNIKTENKPEVWVYDIPYQSSLKLTIIDGKLSSIN